MRNARRDTPEPLPTPMWAPWKVRALRVLARVFFPLLCSLRVSGRENVPSSGACVLVFNHLTNFDAHLIYSVLRRTDVTGLVAAEYRDRPVHRLLVETSGGMWLRRAETDVRAIRTAVRLLEKGWIVGIAPEGRRSPTRSLAQARPGAAFLATRSGAPVLPVGLTGIERLGRSARPEVTVHIGEPFHVAVPPGRSRRDGLQAVTETIMAHLASLLPPAYRGVYGEAHRPSAGARTGAPDPLSLPAPSPSS